MSEPTSQGLLGRGAACLCGVGIYLPETVGQGCSLFKWCLNLPSKDCGTGLRPVFTVLEPTSSGLRARGAACLCGVRTYLLGIVGYGCNLFMQYRNLPLGDLWQGCSLFMQCWNLPPKDCGQKCSLFMWTYLPEVQYGRHPGICTISPHNVCSPGFKQSGVQPTKSLIVSIPG